MERKSVQAIVKSEMGEGVLDAALETDKTRWVMLLK